MNKKFLLYYKSNTNHTYIHLNNGFITEIENDINFSHEIKRCYDKIILDIILNYLTLPGWNTGYAHLITLEQFNE